jgi:hypothetical protein
MELVSNKPMNVVIVLTILHKKYELEEISSTFTGMNFRLKEP